MWNDKTSTPVPVGNRISVLVVPRPFLSYPAHKEEVWKPNLITVPHV